MVLQRLLVAESLGVDVAARLIGMPESTLRLHADRGRIPGARRLPGGRRLLPRDGLISYLRRRGIIARNPLAQDRRRAVRIPLQKAWLALRVRRPGDPIPLGWGRGRLEDISTTGVRVGDLSWRGCLPGPGASVSCVVRGGSLDRCGADATLAWVVWRRDDARMGLRLSSFPDSECRAKWRGFVRDGLASKRGAGEAAHGV